MKKVMVIAWRDFKTLVTSPTFLFVAGLCGAIWSAIFLPQIFAFEMEVRKQGGLNIHQTLFANHIRFANVIFIFAIPAITMKAIAEEKRLKTFDLLLTAPITAWDIAFGKFLATFGAALILLLINMAYPLSTLVVADFNFAPLLSSYGGLALVIGVWTAAGLFASAVTSSILVSVILAVILNFSLWFLVQFAEVIPDPSFTELIEYVSIPYQFFSFFKGSFKISSMVFFLSTIGFFIFLCERVVESSRWR